MNSNSFLKTIGAFAPIVFFSLLFSSCQSSSRMPNIDEFYIVSADSLIIDSLVFSEIDIRKPYYIRYNNNPNHIFIESDNKLYVFENDQLVQFAVGKDLSGRKKVILPSGKILMFDNLEYCILDTLLNQKQFIRGTFFSQEDSVVYNLKIDSPNDFVIFDSSIFAAQLIAVGNKKSSNKLDLLNTYANAKTGIFSLKGDSLTLIRTIPKSHPSENIINTKYGLSIKTYFAQDSSSFFAIDNFYDTIFRYNHNGKYLDKIGIPSGFNFRYYNNSDADFSVSSSDLNWSRISGHKNWNLHCIDGKYLMLVTSFCEQTKTTLNLVMPSLNDLDWFIQIYDLDSKKWHRAISFGPDYDMRDIFINKTSIYVRDKTKNIAEFKKINF